MIRGQSIQQGAEKVFAEIHGLSLLNRFRDYLGVGQGGTQARGSPLAPSGISMPPHFRRASIFSLPVSKHSEMNNPYIIPGQTSVFRSLVGAQSRSRHLRMQPIRPAGPPVQIKEHIEKRRGGRTWSPKS